MKQAIQNIVSHLKGDQQEKAGYQAGREKYDAELWKEAKEEAMKELTGKQLLTELQQLKDNIGGDNCSKCKRTKHGKCKRCMRTLKGLDHLAGRIARLYTDKEERWKRDEPV